MPGFKIRRATAKDMDVLVEHRQGIFEEMNGAERGSVDRAGDPYGGWAKEMMRRKLYHGYVVTDDRGNPAASGCVWMRQVQPSRGCPASLVPYLMSIYTVPRFRRKGLARMIVQEAMEWAKKSGYSEMTLHASSAGRKVYTKLGWKRTWEMEAGLE